jgi:PAS domain S-box-containing protein
VAKHQASLETAQRIAHLGSWDWNLQRNEVYWSPETFRILGLAPDAVAPSVDRFLAQVHPQDRAAAEQAISDLVRTGEFSGRLVRLVRPDGNVRHVQLQGLGSFDARGAVHQLAGTIQDVTELKEAEQRIRHLAYYDGATGLPNRQFFTERLAQALALAKRHRGQLGVLALDLDQFKRINDTLGHTAGNELLAAVARRLADAVREADSLGRPDGESPVPVEASDLIARLEGDEFCLLITDLAQYHDAAKVARRLLQELRKPFRIGNREMFVTASIGLALYPLDGEDADSLLKNAGAAMHFAKEQGRDNYQFYSRAMNATALEKLSMESQLRKALERGEFLLNYQPKVRLDTGELIGMEALLRWKHPERGVVSPEEFIPVLEETGLIMPAGEWVIRRACQDLKAWQAAGLAVGPVSVNLSARQFRQADLHERIKRIVGSAGVEPGLIELEITESQLMQDPDQAIRVMHALCDAGMRIAIDDFGTGYSSLAYLTRFPVGSLKIDRSFVKDMLSDTGDGTIVRTIIEMAHSLGFTVIAEGVETEEQAAFLRLLRCEQAQGYLFARPMSAEDLALGLSSQPAL